MTGSRTNPALPQRICAITAWRRFPTTTQNPRLADLPASADSMRRAGPASRPYVLATLRALRLDPGPSTRRRPHASRKPAKPQVANLLTEPRPFRDDKTPPISLLSGDRNPPHSDPEFAAAAGFPRPILHGLCTYGVACKAPVDTLLDGDVSRVSRSGARFAGVVSPARCCWRGFGTKITADSSPASPGPPATRGRAVGRGADTGVVFANALGGLLGEGLVAL